MTTGAPDDDALARVARLAFSTAAEGASDDAHAGPLDDGELALREFGEYELLEVLGAGGMGVVYRARHRVLEREVALKIIAEDARNDDSDAQFLDEARNAARLNHPNIVPVHDVGTRGGLHYLSMQLVDGEHLGRRIARGVLAERDAIALLLPVCDALDYAHRLGLLHLDLKPANILVDSRGAPLVADFGLARRVGADGSARARDVSGTPAYMAPEQLEPDSGRLTVATDVYSLGAVLYEMLAGVSPHGRGDAADLAARARSGTIVPLARHRGDVSRDLAAVCAHCLAHDPAQRYPSVAALADDLRRIRDGLPVSVRRPRLRERARAWVRREPRFAAALAFALAAVLTGAIATLSLWLQSERARERAELSAELGARLFVRGGGEYDRRTSRELVRWLQERLPGDSTRQAAVLSDYFAALQAEEAGVRRYTLQHIVMQAFGVEYQREVLARLRARGDARHLLFAARLAWDLEDGRVGPAGFPEAIAAAAAAAPDSAEVMFVAATHCPRLDEAQPVRCALPDAAERFVELDPDNVFAWVILASQVPAGDAARVLHEAAQRERVDDYYTVSRDEFADAMVATRVPLPPQLAVAFAEAGADPARVVAYEYAWWAPDAFVHRVGWLCDPRRNAAFVASMHEDCLKVGQALNAAPVSIGTMMLGSAIIRRLAPGSALAQRMIEQRRTMIYRRETLARSWGRQPFQPPDWKRRTRTIRRYGELAAAGMALARRGLPPDPPAEWTPNDPAMMELPENRPDLE